MDELRLSDIQKGFLLVLGLFFAAGLYAQNTLLSPDFEALLAEQDLHWQLAADAPYKVVDNRRYPYFEPQLHLSSRKEGMDILVHILLPDTTDQATLFPTLMLNTLVTHLATNEEDYFITQLSISEDELQGQLGADWGVIYNFKPKAGWSHRAHCRLLCFYRKDKAMVQVAFLYDRASLALDERLYLLRYGTTVRY